MVQRQTKPAPGEHKKHGDSLASASQQPVRSKLASVIPLPENGGHSRSAAAHLGDAKGSAQPNANNRSGSHPTALREPPMEISRAGKQHR